MGHLFAFILLLSMLGLVIGLVRPSIVRLASRKRVALVFGAVILVSGFVVGATSPEVSSAPAPAQPTTTALKSATTTPVAPAPTPTQKPVAVASDACTPAVLQAFPKVMQLYETIYQEGKTALGTTQYADANAGLAAFSNPNSAASKFSAWHQTFFAQQSSLLDQPVNAYRAASDCYYNSNLTEPDAIANWRDDMGNVITDIGTWGSDAVDWQIRTTSDAKLAQDEAAISNDMATVQQDLASLKK